MNFLNQKSLSVMVFVGIMLAVSLIAALAVPYINSSISAIFISLQTDVNKRLATNISEFINRKLQQGISKEEIVADLTTLLSNTNSELGYSCVIDANTGDFLYHPDSAVLGKSVASKNAFFTDINESIKNEPFQNFVTNRQHGEGVLYYPKMAGNYHEAVSVINIPQYNWTVSTHENINQMRLALDKLGKNIMLVSIIIGLMVALLSTWVSRKISLVYERRIETERDKNDVLLRRTLPNVVVDEINKNGSFAPKRYEHTTVMFADIVGFTQLSSAANPKDIVHMLDSIFMKFDHIAENHHVEKIKTMGDCYMACVGSPEHDPLHASRIMKFALELLPAMAEINAAFKINVCLRIGIHSGPVIGGVIGQSKFAFDIWGDTVNVASRMESTGIAGAIQVSAPAYALLKDAFPFVSRGEIEVKGKGLMSVYVYQPS